MTKRKKMLNNDFGKKLIEFNTLIINAIDDDVKRALESAFFRFLLNIVNMLKANNVFLIDHIRDYDDRTLACATSLGISLFDDEQLKVKKKTMNK